MAKTNPYLPRKPEEKAPSESHWQAPEFAKNYPAVHSLLATALQDGEDREGATITLYADQNRLKFCISDRHTGQSLFGTLDDVEALWKSIEGYVLAHRDDWRVKGEADRKRR